MAYPPRMPQARIAAHDLACRRGDRILFRGLSFVVEPGQALQVAGPNGVGKSSLLRLVAGLSRPFAGTIERAGTIGLVDERPALDPELPLADALAFWSRVDGTTARHIERLGLGDLLDVPVRYLSTGQRKRAALSRLLGQNASVWLLDEPLNGLDVDAARMVEDLTAAHCRDGGIALVASHQPFGVAGLTPLTLADYGA
jgi:heme exporter protein A